MAVEEYPFDFIHTAGTRPGKSGWRFIAKTDFTINSITKSASSNATYGSVLDNNKDVIERALYVSNVATFSSPVTITDTSTYYVVSDKDGAQMTNHYYGPVLQDFSLVVCDVTGGLDDGNDTNSWAFDIEEFDYDLPPPPPAASVQIMLGGAWKDVVKHQNGTIISATETITEDTADMDVSEISVLFVDPSGDTDITGFTDGVEGQILHVAVLNTDFDVTMVHNSGTQKVFLQSGASEELTEEFGGWTLICDGTHWYDTKHA